ncbi:HNH endonuclease [Bacillus sp. CFBP9009]
MLNYPEINFQYQVELEDVDEGISIDDQPKERPFETFGSASITYKRDTKPSKKAIVLANYLCEIDHGHEDFISKITKENYVEAHHLIPMEFQGEFERSIDVEANIVSLCPSYHKKLHHGEYSVIEPLIEKLYDERIERLNKCEISLSKDDLLNYYK